MSSFELTLAPVRPQREPLTGRWLPGHASPLKGRKRSEYMSKAGMERSDQNLRLPHRHSPLAGVPPHGVVAVTDDGRFAAFPSEQAAADRLGLARPNIARCCRDNASRRKNKKTGRVNSDHKCKGLRFYFEDAPVWAEKVGKQERPTTNQNQHPAGCHV